MPVATAPRTTAAERSRALEVFAGLLEQQEELRRKYRRKPKAFLRKYAGTAFLGDWERLFDDVYEDRVQRVVGVGPRSSGKTKTVTELGFCKFFFQDWDVFIVGGSLEQSKAAISYVHDIAGEPELLEELPQDETQTLVRGESGNWIKAAPASTKAIRGQHSKGRPLLLILDEEAEMKPEILRAAMRMGKDASRFVVIRISTNHLVTGTFAELVEQNEKMGYRKYQVDSFDVAETCRVPDCRLCFRALYDEYPGQLDRLQKLQHEFCDDYCKERPRENRGGWISLQDLKQSIIESPREWFETEDMGWKPRGEGSVLPPDKVKAAFLPEQKPRVEQGVPVVAGIDWGFKGMTAVNLYQFVADKMRHHASQDFSGTAVEGIVSYLDLAGGDLVEEATGREYDKSRRREIHVYADSSHPFNNAELRDEGFSVEEVVFLTYKETGAGALQSFFEREAYEGCAEYKRCLAQMLKWRRGKSGRIAKTDDHHPDSALCATKFYVDMRGSRVVRAKLNIRAMGEAFLGRIRGSKGPRVRVRRGQG